MQVLPASVIETLIELYNTNLTHASCSDPPDFAIQLAFTLRACVQLGFRLYDEFTLFSYECHSERKLIVYYPQ